MAGHLQRHADRGGVTALPAIQPMDVAAWVEELGYSHAVPTVKLRLAAIRHLFGWLVTGQVMPINPAHSVRGPSYSTRKGKIPVLSPEEARQLLASIPADTLAGKCDRALVGLMTYTFARIGVALSMEVRDVYVQNRHLWVRLREKGGQRHEVPCHHSLEAYLDDYLNAGGLRDHPRSPLFRTIGRGTGVLTETALPQPNAYAMIQRRAAAAGINTGVCSHTFRTTGIMANHSSTRTTELYDRRSDEVSLDEVERRCRRRSRRGDRAPGTGTCRSKVSFPAWYDTSLRGHVADGADSRGRATDPYGAR